MQNLFSVLKKFVDNIYVTVLFVVTDIKIRLLASRSPLRVMIGAGSVCQKGWLPTDIEHLDMLDIKDWRKYFREDSIDAIMAEHVWEHLSEEEAIVAAKNCYKYLKPGGYLRIAVPDGCHPSEDYRAAVAPGGTGAGSDDHKILYTYKSLATVFEKAGFEVDLLEYFDEHGVFHEKPWNPDDGLILRSKGFDDRNRSGVLNYTSIILDARKTRD